MIRLTTTLLLLGSLGSALPSSASSQVPPETAPQRVRSGEHHGGVGAALGALAGTTLGAVVGYVSYQPEWVQDVRCEVPWPGAIPRNCVDHGSEDVGSRTGETLMAAGVGLLLGTTVGYVVGRMLPRWAEVDVESFRAGPDGVAFAVSVATP